MSRISRKNKKSTTKYFKRTYNSISKGIAMKLLNINPVSETLDSVKISESYTIDGIKIDIICNINSNIQELKAYRNIHLPSILSAVRGLPIYVKKALSEKSSITICDSDILYVEHGAEGIAGDYCPWNKQIRVGYRGFDTVSTLFHEIGHFIDNILCDFKNYDNDGCIYFLSRGDIFVRHAFEQEAHLFRKYAQTDVEEFIASVFEHYFLHNELPQDCKETSYVVYDYLKSLECMYNQNSINKTHCGAYAS